jgi:hypothetical protein
MHRIKYGLETDLDNGCPDCHVKKGGYHKKGCDHEECPICHCQLSSCNHVFEDFVRRSRQKDVAIATILYGDNPKFKGIDVEKNTVIFCDGRFELPRYSRYCELLPEALLPI